MPDFDEALLLLRLLDLNRVETVKNPRPEQLADWISHCFAGKWRERDYINIVLSGCDAMTVLNGDDLYMILCNPDRQLMELASQLAGAEGLFFYRAPV